MSWNWKGIAGLVMFAVALCVMNCGSNSDRANLPKSESSDQGAVQPAQTAADQDSKITSAVEKQLHDDSSVAPADIEVKTNNGVVSLHGKVPSQRIAERALQLAEGVDGVRTVYSYLKIASDEQS